MEEKDYFGKCRKGSSLMFVVIAIAFVGILATIVLRITLINVNIKSVDRTVKKDFYSADGVMDMVNTSVQSMALDCMAEAYSDLMSQYASAASVSSNQNQIQMKFAYSYLDKVVHKLTGGNIINGTSGYYEVSSSEYQRDVIYQYYEKTVDAATYLTDIQKMKYKDFYKHGTWDASTEDAATRPMIELQFSTTNTSAQKSLLIKNVQVSYRDDSKGTDADSVHSSEITTDIRLVVPNLSFASSNIYPEFTKYAIIGDDQILSDMAGSDVNINGYVYAGHNGLLVDTGTVSIGGSAPKVICRGDISVRQSGKIQLGSTSSNAEVWTENYKTRSTYGSSSTQDADLEVYAESYVHDDLSLDANYSNVRFKAGNYYGYSFNKNNVSGSNTTIDSEYSSAITINGKHASLEMDGNLKTILLGGRAFISRNRESSHETAGTASTDIALGQAVSVKSDQNFYKVDNDDLADGFTNPMLRTTYERAQADGKETAYTVYGTEYKTVLSESKRTELSGLLNSRNPVTEIHYSISNTDATAEMIYFYYNFKDEEAANQYYQSYISENALHEKIKDSEYLRFTGSGDGLKISPQLFVFANSNITTKIDQNTLESQDATISSSNLQNFLDRSIEYASLYKSYQLTLTDGLANEFSQRAQTEGSDAFDLKKNDVTATEEDDTHVKNENQLFEYKLISKESDQTYKFVKEAATDPTTYGFTENLSGGDIKMKAVKVEISTTTTGARNGYAVFIASTTSDPSNDNVLMSTITSILQGMGYNRTDDNNNLLMVVSNCNIGVDEDVRGTVISDTIVKLRGTSTKITADSTSLQAMITVQKKLEGTVSEDKKFLKYFQCFDGVDFGSSEELDQVVRISDYVTYEGWKKNDDSY